MQDGQMQSPEGAAPQQGQQVMGDAMQGIQQQMEAVMSFAQALQQAGKPGAEKMAQGVEMIQAGLQEATGGGQPQQPQGPQPVQPA